MLRIALLPRWGYNGNTRRNEMAKCTSCNKEMENSVSCDEVPVTVKGQSLTPIRWFGTRPCHDCNTPPGGFHHPGCDMESCPNCYGQLISCNCIEEGLDL